LYSIAAPEYRSTTEFNNGLNADIITTLEKNFPEAYEQVKDYCKKFAGANIEDTCYRVWKFLKDNITYKADGAIHQKIKLPSRFIADAEGDCKSFSLFAASILAHFYKVGFRYVSFNNNSTPTHVYVIARDNAGKTIIVDGVWHSFNSQKQYTHKIDHWMKISTLSGVGTLEEVPTKEIEKRIARWYRVIENYKPGTSERSRIRARISQLEAVYKARTGQSGIGDKAKRDARKASGKASGAKKVALAPGRAAFLELVRLNVRGLAHKLSKLTPDKATAKWKKLGGNPTKLLNAITIGKKKKPLLGESKKSRGVKGVDDGIGIAPAVAAVLVAAGPVLVAFANMMKGTGATDAEGGSFDELLGDSTQAGGDTSFNPDSNDVDITDKGSGADHSSFSLSSPIVLGALAVGAFLLLKK